MVRLILGRSNSHAQKCLGKFKKPRISRKIVSPQQHQMEGSQFLEKHILFPWCSKPVAGGIHTISLTSLMNFSWPEKDPKKASFAMRTGKFLRTTLQFSRMYFYGRIIFFWTPAPKKSVEFCPLEGISSRFPGLAGGAVVTPRF